MPAELLSGKVASGEVRAEIKHEIEKLKESYPDFMPGLAIIQVGDRPDSNVYIRHKLAAGAEVGVKVVHVKLNQETTQEQLEKEIDRLNCDICINGIIIQLPLDSKCPIDAEHVIDRIKAEKDVDGLTRVNAGRLVRGELKGTIIPCTPRGCMHLVEKTGRPIAGQRVVVLGRSKIVGSPAAQLFLWHHATVTICHSKTKDLADMCRQADILIVAIGRAAMVKGDWIKPGAIVIDCGINVLEGQGVNGKNKLVGDVEFDTAKEVASFLTPVPGGVGPMTVAMLLRNTLDQAKAEILRD